MGTGLETCFALANEGKYAAAAEQIRAALRKQDGRLPPLLVCVWDAVASCFEALADDVPVRLEVFEPLLRNQGEATELKAGEMLAYVGQMLAGIAVYFEEANRLTEVEAILRLCLTNGLAVSLDDVLTAFNTCMDNMAFAKAQDWVAYAELTYPDVCKTLWARGELLREQGQIDSAVLVLERAVACGADSIVPLIALVRALDRLDDVPVSRGLRVLDRALEIDATDEYVLYWRGRFLRHAREYEKARQVLFSLKSSPTKGGSACLECGITFLLEGRWEEAIVELEQSLGHELATSALLSALFAIAYCAEKERDWKKSRSCLEKAEELGAAETDYEAAAAWFEYEREAG